MPMEVSLLFLAENNKISAYAPIFISRLKDAYLGHASAVFEVAVAASPAPKMQWHFQGKPIESDDRRTIEQVSMEF